MKYRFREKTMAMPAGIALGAVIEIALTGLLAAILVNMLLREKVLEQNLGYGIWGILATAPMMGGIAACGAVRRRKILVCIGMGLVYLLLLLSMTALFFGGQYQGIGDTVLPIMMGSSAAVLLTSKGERKGSGKRKRKKK